MLPLATDTAVSLDLKVLMGVDERFFTALIDR